MKTFIGSQVVNTSAEWAEQIGKVGDNGLIMFGHFEGTTPEVHCARARALDSFPPPGAAAPARARQPPPPGAAAPAARARERTNSLPSHCARSVGNKTNGGARSDSHVTTPHPHAPPAPRRHRRRHRRRAPSSDIDHSEFRDIRGQAPTCRPHPPLARRAPRASLCAPSASHGDENPCAGARSRSLARARSRSRARAGIGRSLALACAPLARAPPRTIRSS